MRIKKIMAAGTGRKVLTRYVHRHPMKKGIPGYRGAKLHMHHKIRRDCD